MSGIIAQNSGRHTGLVKAASGGGGVWNLILTQTASSSATIDFTSGIDSTYDEYVFKFINIHPATSDAYLTFQTDTGTNTSYNQTVTSTFYFAQQGEGDDGALAYSTTRDLAQSTSFIPITLAQNNDNDGNACGTLHIFDMPNNGEAAFVKHFLCRSVEMMSDPGLYESYSGGYVNTTTALTRVQFKMSSGNIDSGTISLFGIT